MQEASDRYSGPARLPLGAGHSMGAAPAELDALVAALVEPLARRVVELLEQPAEAPAQRLLTASELAGVLGVSPYTVYKHKAQLGVVALGSGRRPRLRFNLERAQAAWRSPVLADEHEPSAPSPRPRRRRGRPSNGKGLLPVRGSIPAGDQLRRIA